VWSQESAAKLDWVVVGGESGPGARPMHPQWARDLRDQCTAAGVAFLFKQWGSWAPIATHFASDHDEQGAWDTYVNLDGTTGQWAISEDHDLATNHTGEVGPGATSVTRMSKKSAGREIDNRTWDEYPTARKAVTA
jgi:protein gp37